MSFYQDFYRKSKVYNIYNKNNNEKTILIRYIVKENTLEKIESKEPLAPGDYFNEIIIPDYFETSNGNVVNINTISQYVFRGNNINRDVSIEIGTLSHPIKQVCINDNISIIDMYAFSGASHIEKVKWPQKCTTIPTGCFANCENLKILKDIDAVTNIGNFAFYNCGFKNFKFPKNCIIIPHYCFSNCEGLCKINISGPIVEIGTCAFFHTQIKQVGLNSLFFYS